MTVLIINNYYKDEYLGRADQIARVLQRAGVDRCELWSFSEINEKAIPAHIEAIVLSGSTAHLQENAHSVMYAAEIELVKRVEIPVLGICFGHQLIARAYGSEIRRSPKAISGSQAVQILEPDEIFSSWTQGEEIVLTQSHRDYVADLPEDFIWLATSETCKLEAIRHRRKPIYGVQAHVERASERNPDGWQILRNFVAAHEYNY